MVWRFDGTPETCIVVNSRVFIKKKYCLKIVINNKIEKKTLA